MAETASLSESPAERSADGGLTLTGVSARYGSSGALFEVSFTVAGGTALALLGPNGAGKSTLGRTISGLVPINTGEIWFDGERISGSSAHSIRQKGLAYIPEGRGIFPGLTVLENLRVAVGVLDRGQQRRAALAKAFELFPALGDRRNQRAGSLSGGEQQMLALARVLATDPKLVVADEMSLGLAPMIVDTVLETIAKARDAGITIVLIEQFVHRALALADSCVIMSRGHVSWSGRAEDARGEVLEHYMGENAG
jgi:branched-chain amino acid transport system ATP-binding protein